METICKQCGATPTFNYLKNTFYCSYCGQPVTTAQQAGCIPFRHQLADFRQAVIVFLTSGDLTPIDLLPSATFKDVHQIYYPFCLADEQHTPFPQPVYAGADRNEKEVISEFAAGLDPKAIVPLNSVLIADIRIEQQYFEGGGLVYYPVWWASYRYGGNSYPVYMDDVTGRVTGGKPQIEAMNAPQRSAVYERYLLVGFCIWVGLLFLRAALAAFVGVPFEGHTLNNLLFSEPVEKYWFIRGLFLLGVFPLLMATVFYGLLSEIHYKLYRKQRRLMAENNQIIFLKSIIPG